MIVINVVFDAPPRRPWWAWSATARLAWSSAFFGFAVAMLLHAIAHRIIWAVVAQSVAAALQLWCARSAWRELRP